MRKFLVKLFNLIYLAGAVLSIVALCIKPIIRTDVDLSLTSDQVADRLVVMFENNKNNEESSESKALVKAQTREESSSSGYKVSREDVVKAFPDGFKMTVQVKVPTSAAFQLKNKEVLTQLVKQNIEDTLIDVVKSVSKNLKVLFEDVTENYALEELEKQIQNSINQYFTDATPVTEGEVQAMYDNVKETLSGDEPISVDDLANIIVGEKNPDGTYQEGTLLYILNARLEEEAAQSKYVVVDPKPSKEEIDEEIAKGDDGKYFIKTGEDTYARPANSDDYNDQTYYKKGYDDKDINGENIAEKLAASLNSIPGLVEIGYCKSSPSEEAFNKTVMSTTYYVQTEDLGYINANTYNALLQYYTASYAAATPTQEQVEADIAKSVTKAEYFVLDGEKYVRATKWDESLSYFLRSFDAATPTEEEVNATIMSNKYYTLSGEDNYTFAKSYDKDTQYYVYGTIVNDVDTAMANFIQIQTNGGSKAHLRTRDGELVGEKSQQEIEDALKEYLYKNIPFDGIYAITANLDGYAAYILFGLIALFAFPWVVFGILTLCRLFRKRKVWTRPWIVLVLAFPQLILGMVLTYGYKYFLPMLIGKFPKLAPLGSTVGLRITTGCLIPSFVYVAFFAMTLIYAILVRPFKKRYKLESRFMRYDNRGQQYYGGRVYRGPKK